MTPTLQERVEKTYTQHGLCRATDEFQGYLKCCFTPVSRGRITNVERALQSLGLLAPMRKYARKGEVLKTIQEAAKVFDGRDCQPGFPRDKVARILYDYVALAESRWLYPKRKGHLDPYPEHDRWVETPAFFDADWNPYHPLTVEYR